MVALTELATSGELWQALADSLRAPALGYALAALVGIAVGIASAWYPSLGRVSEVYVAILLAVPMSAVIPLVVMGLGIGLASRVMVVFLFAVPYIIANVADGVRNVDPVLVEMARSYGAGPRQVLTRVVLPSSVPAILTGLRVGLARAFVGMVTAELLLLAVGVGRLIDEFQAAFQVAKLWAMILVLLVLSNLCVGALQYWERQLIRWRA